MERWSSDAYGHFNMPPGDLLRRRRGQVQILVPSVRLLYYSVRVHLADESLHSHPKKSCTRVRTDPSTMNLNKHINKCDPPIVTGQGSIAQYAAGSTYNKAEFRYLTTVWVTHCHRPFAIVEDEPLQDMFKMLYAKVEVPSAKTVSRNVKEVWAISKVEVASFLQRLKSAIHIAFDGWTSPNVISYLGVVVMFEDQGALASMLPDFVR